MYRPGTNALVANSIFDSGSDLEYDFSLKFKLLGDSGIGKTSLLNRFVEGTYTESYISSIGIEFKTKVINVKDKKVKLYVFDNAGQERFRIVESQNNRGQQAALLCFDVTDQVSFSNIKSLYNEIKNSADYQSTSMFLIGTKHDDVPRRVITEIEARALADELNIPYIETSAKSNHQVELAFNEVALEVSTKLGLIKQTEISNDSSSSTPPKEKGGCLVM
jgi:Ras-related protein Rab-1A